MKFELSLQPNDVFFRELKNELTHKLEDGFFTPTVIAQIARSTLETIKEISIDKNIDISGRVKFSFEHAENVYPDFYNILSNHIDTALNRKIHMTSLERVCDEVIDFMVVTAKKQENLIDADKELVYITNYVNKTWSGVGEEFFPKVWEMAQEKTKNIFYEHGFNNVLYSMMKCKKDITIEGKDPLHYVSDIMLKQMELRELVKSDYEDNVNLIIAEVKQFCTKPKPNGWSKLAKGYTDYAGMKEFDSAQAREDFGGMNSGTAGSGSIEVRISLPHVMYDDKCQGRKPIETLVGAIYGHAYVMNEKNNGHKMLEEWQDLNDKIQNAQPKDDIKAEFNHPLNRALLKLVDGKPVEHFLKKPKF